MRIYQLAAVTVALGFISAPASADNDGRGFGVCKSGFADDTVVSTEARGEVTVGQLQVGDRVWSYNEIIGRNGWSKVLRRVDGGQAYRILADFTEPGSDQITKACWNIQAARQVAKN